MIDIHSGIQHSLVCLDERPVIRVGIAVDVAKDHVAAHDVRPRHHGVYIRYFNQTRYEDYLSAHKKQFLDTLALCPNWKFVGFYVDEGSTAPNMENAPEWSRLLQDCYEEKVNLIITQKASNISKKLSELSFCTRLLAALPKPVGVYFVSEDIYTLASYYQEDLHDPYFLPDPGWKILPDDEPRREMLHD